MSSRRPVSPPAGRSAATIDWSQLWYPGPRRVFSAAEMAEFGADAPSVTLWLVAAVNAGTLLAVLGVLAPPPLMPSLLLLALGLLAIVALAAWWVWWRPSRWPLMQASIGIALAMLALTELARELLPLREHRLWFAVLLSGGAVMGIVLIWFVAVWRAQQIEGRMREREERERAVEMARRLAAAQIEPHFLFNTLASVQHWVSTGDPRAAQMLTALTGYLRATLPLFRRPQLALGDELSAVRHYLDLMRLRLGERLEVTIDAPALWLGQRLPPGLVLTLVENALQHGIEPLLGGGRLRLAVCREGDTMRLEVQDNGPGPAPGTTPSGRGTGLANARERLALLHGAGRSGVELQALAEGGTLARLHWPFDPDAPAPGAS
jgi:signal transduction histidine kinase